MQTSITDHQDNLRIATMSTSGESDEVSSTIDGGSIVGDDSVKGFSDSSKSDLAESKSSGGSNGEKTTNATQSLKKELATRETEFIFKLRVFVILILIAAGAGVSTLVYLISRNSEQEEFESNFQGAAQQVLDSFEAIKTDRISALSALAVAAIAHGVDHSRSWPFVALSYFQQRCLTARSNSGFLQVTINPFVSEEERKDWEKYVVEVEDSQWIQEAREYQENTGIDQFLTNFGEDFNRNPQPQSIAYRDASNDYERIITSPNSGPYLPYWEMSPLLSNEDINTDIFADEIQRKPAELCLETGSVVLGEPLTTNRGGIWDSDDNDRTRVYAQLLSIAAGKEKEYLGDPMTHIYIPIFDSFESDRKPAAVMTGLFNWASAFENILPPNSVGVDVVLENKCHGSYTYRINGDDVIRLGHGDLHERAFNDFEIRSDRLEKGTIADGTKEALSFHENECYHTIAIYPSEILLETYKSSTPVVIAFAVAIIFLFAVAMFVVYDRLVERRQKLVLQKAIQSTAIVSSLFPKNVRDRLMQTTAEEKSNTGGNNPIPNSKFKSMMGEKAGDMSEKESAQPIADLFPNCTVLFADIAGFTAWSSTRDPAQVFTLLQSVYQAFDKVAARRRVFKVETIGDSYVAVTGLPEPQEQHAIIMARFAVECRSKLHKVTRQLEVVLGPDTGDLSMRFGMHSGPVTAGVLRGDRARFQLFGDTVNTAARMESTGMRGRIQVSLQTAEVLQQCGKGSWLTPREDVVYAKGLGKVLTFWLDAGNQGSSVSGETTHVSPEQALSTKRIEEGGDVINNLKNDRLVDWMTEILSEYVKKVISKRNAMNAGKKSPLASTSSSRTSPVYRSPEGQICLDEVVEVLKLPKFDAKGFGETTSPLSPEVLTELREYVRAISDAYQNNPFHNFDHACHVTMSVHKLLRRVTTPDISGEDLARAQLDKNHLASRLHDYTHGINSDPVTSMAIMFSALIHDVDHRGVSNVQMSKEEPEMAQFYKQKSVAEQNSLDVAWDLLMSKRFDQLRLSMFGTGKSELMRFRQALVNLVLATDIFDKELNDLRKARWEKAFHSEEEDEEKSGSSDGESKIEADNLRATIVLEHIIQASDVSHTMQHWHVYLKWNRRLFAEMTAAYRAGRMGADPAVFWYEGELKFFDNYIIPLAKKLQECQVFGVSSDEFLNYAKSNRLEWQEKGMAVVKEMLVEIEEVGSSKE